MTCLGHGAGASHLFYTFILKVPPLVVSEFQRFHPRDLPAPATRAAVLRSAIRGRGGGGGGGGRT